MLAPFLDYGNIYITIKIHPLWTATPERGRVRKALVVEDEEPIRRLLEKVVKRMMGFDSISAASLGEAEDVLDSEVQFDLAILDGHLGPGETSLPLAQRLRRSGFTGPIVCISGCSKMQGEMQRLAGSVPCPKPFFPNELVTLVRDLLVREEARTAV